MTRGQSGNESEQRSPLQKVMNKGVAVEHPLDINGELVWLMLAKTDFIRETILSRFKYTYMAELSRSDAKILSAVQRGGTTVSEIAKIRGISRQATHKAILGIVDLGYLRFVPIPNNAKTMRVEWTDKGRAFKQDMYRALVDIERDISRKYGNEVLPLLKEILSQEW